MELMRLMIPRLMSANKIPMIMNVIFFLASLISPHLDDSMIRMIALKMTIVTESTIVILKRNFVTLTISGASVSPCRLMTEDLNISFPTASFQFQRLMMVLPNAGWNACSKRSSAA